MNDELVNIYKKLRRHQVLTAGKMIAKHYNLKLAIADSVAHEQWVMGGDLDKIIDEYVSRDYGNCWECDIY